MKVIRSSLALGLVGVSAFLAAPLAPASASSVSSASELVRNPAPCPSHGISVHEGYQYNADGDTLDSQKAAFAIGGTMADSDLWVTKDNYIVEIHDADVSHTTNGTGLITDMTIDQWGALRTKKHHEPLATLQESMALKRASQPGRYLMMETKYSFSKMANLQLLDDQIVAAGMQSHIIIYSAFLSQLETLNQIDPSLILWYKAQSIPPVGDVAGLDGVMLPPDEMTADNVATFHDVGMTVTRERAIESLGNWNAFLATGADNLMTDKAHRMIDLCRELG